MNEFERTKKFTLGRILVILGYIAIIHNTLQFFKLDWSFALIIMGTIGWFNNITIDPIVRMILIQKKSENVKID